MGSERAAADACNRIKAMLAQAFDAEIERERNRCIKSIDGKTIVVPDYVYAEHGPVITLIVDAIKECISRGE